MTMQDVSRLALKAVIEHWPGGLAQLCLSAHENRESRSVYVLVRSENGDRSMGIGFLAEALIVRNPAVAQRIALAYQDWLAQAEPDHVPYGGGTCEDCESPVGALAEVVVDAVLVARYGYAMDWPARRAAIRRELAAAMSPVLGRDRLVVAGEVSL